MVSATVSDHSSLPSNSSSRASAAASALTGRGAQVRRGEMLRLRRAVAAIFGGRRKPQTVRTWCDRVDRAPAPPQVRTKRPANKAPSLRRRDGNMSDCDEEHYRNVFWG